MAQSFPNLYSPLKIGNMLLKNRLAMAPMSLNYSTETGSVVQRQIDYFVERARGGIGMIVSESNYVSLEGRGAPRRVGIYADDMVPEHRRLVEAVHRENVPIIAELHHSGRATGAGVIGQYPVSASAVQLMVSGDPYVGTIPRALTIAEIESLVELHNQAARRAIEAGYDGVLVHAGHGYLLHQFLSPRTNKRTDRYGGSEENRARFLVDIVRALRESMEPETPILVRLTGSEHTENGYGVDFISRVARWLEDAGASSINISSGAPEELEYLVGPRSFPEGFNAPLAARVKAEVNLPISVVGRIKGLETADTIIAEGKADQLWIGRPLIADPYLPRKAQEGRLEEIRECLACNHCLTLANQGVGVECSVNAEVGREAEMRLVPAERPRRVVVVGGGPGGMEAARIAAERGHSVTLVEKRPRLGGQLLLGAAAPHSVEMGRWARYLVNELRRTGVKVLADTEATPQLLEELRPETVVVATGAKPASLDIPGSGTAHVFNAHEVLGGQCDDLIGRQVVVIGGGLTGVYAAEYLLERDREVSIVEMQDRLMADGNFIEKKVLTLDLCERRVVVLVSTTVEAITSRGVLVTRAGRKELVPADSVVISVGVRPERSLLVQLNVDNWDVHVIGDALAPRRIPQAVQEGARVGRLV